MIENFLKNSPFSSDCRVVTDFNEEMVYYSQPMQIHHLLDFLKDSGEFQILIDVCGVHYPANEKPFEVVYHLLSITNNQRVRIIVQLNECEEIHTVDCVYESACWFERETYDMYGIIFTGSKDGRRILTDYGFEGFPLRKDFPLTGNVEVCYDPLRGEVIYTPVSLAQDYRNFDFKSNWNGGVGDV
jgi:NADH-quinone oxidoreductase subunit C